MDIDLQLDIEELNRAVMHISGGTGEDSTVRINVTGTGIVGVGGMELNANGKRALIHERYNLFLETLDGSTDTAGG